MTISCAKMAVALKLDPCSASVCLSPLDSLDVCVELRFTNFVCSIRATTSGAPLLFKFLWFLSVCLESFLPASA